MVYDPSSCRQLRFGGLKLFGRAKRGVEMADRLALKVFLSQALLAKALKGVRRLGPVALGCLLARHNHGRPSQGVGGGGEWWDCRCALAWCGRGYDRVWRG